jgi:hypothetical protein
MLKAAMRNLTKATREMGLTMKIQKPKVQE